MLLQYLKFKETGGEEETGRKDHYILRTIYVNVVDIFLLI